jgi:hypothetical protein
MRTEDTARHILSMVKRGGVGWGGVEWSDTARNAGRKKEEI